MSQYLSKAKIKVDQMETSKQLLINGIGKTVLPGLAMTGLNEEEYNNHIEPLFANQ